MNKIIVTANTVANDVSPNSITANMVVDGLARRHILPVSALSALFDGETHKAIPLPFERVPDNYGAVFELGGKRWGIEAKGDVIDIVSGDTQITLDWIKGRTLSVYTGKAMVFVGMVKQDGNSYLKTTVFDGKEAIGFPLVEVEDVPKKGNPQLSAVKAQYDMGKRELMVSVSLTYQVKKRINSRIIHNMVFLNEIRFCPNVEECGIIQEFPQEAKAKRPDIMNPRLHLKDEDGFTGDSLYVVRVGVPLSQHFHLFSQNPISDDEIITVMEKLENLKESQRDTFKAVYNQYHAIVLEA